jgi:hypothetical protein
MWNSIRIKAAIFGRHLGQSCIACLTAMTQGDFSTVTLKHWSVALTTGVFAGFFAVLVSFTPLFRRYNPIVSFAIISFLGTLIADRLAHPSGFGGPWTEALATALGAAAISVVISLAPVAAAVERMENPDFHKPPR